MKNQKFSSIIRSKIFNFGKKKILPNEVLEVIPVDETQITEINTLGEQLKKIWQKSKLLEMK